MLREKAEKEKDRDDGKYKEGLDDRDNGGGSSGVDCDKDLKKMKANFDELCDEDKILVFLKRLLNEWKQELEDHPEAEKRTGKGKSMYAPFKQCTHYLMPLFQFYGKKGNERVSCGMEERALKRRPREGAEPKMEPRPAKLGWPVQQQPEGPLCNSDAGGREVCSTIVNGICNRLDEAVPTFPRAVGRREALPPFARVVGRQEQLSSIIHDIMTYREKGLSVTSVEISGIGGIGKTAFAKELYNQICNKYEMSCFIEDARGLVEKHGINKVRTELIGKLSNYELSNFTIEAKKLLKNTLDNADILVVIDNIDSTIPLSTIFIEDDVYLRPTSTIIVTSREDGVLKHDPRVANYCKNWITPKISFLDFHTSKQLFLQYAFGGIDNVNNEFDERINKLVQQCYGVPLQLISLGTKVYKEEIQLRKYPYYSINYDGLVPDLLHILEISYINFNTELEKCLFLDVATFFRWEKVDSLLKLHEDGESEFLNALDVLKKKHFIEVKGGFLHMHDMYVKLGRRILQEESVCPGLFSRMWHPDDVKRILSKCSHSKCSHTDVMDSSFYKEGIKKVRALSLHGTDVSSPVLDVDGHGNPRPWPADAFSGMSSLEVLFLNGNCIEGDLSKLPRTLKWLRWTNFPYQSMPPTLCLKSVRILELSRSPLTQSLNPKLPTNLQGLISRICRRGWPDCLSKLTQYLRPNANSLFNQLFTNTRLSRGHPESLAVNLRAIYIPLILYLFLLITPGPWQRFLPQ